MKLTPGVDFTNIFMLSFYPCRSQKCKMADDLTVILAFGIYACNSFSKNAGKIKAWGQFHQHSMYSFYARKSQKRKKAVKLSIFFTLSGSTSSKAVCKMLAKLIPALGHPFLSANARGCQSALRGSRTSYSSQQDLPRDSFANPSETNFTIFTQKQQKVRPFFNVRPVIFNKKTV